MILADADLKSIVHSKITMQYFFMIHLQCAESIKQNVLNPGPCGDRISNNFINSMVNLNVPTIKNSYL
jgi:hypothetical protein